MLEKHPPRAAAGSVPAADAVDPRRVCAIVGRNTTPMRYPNAGLLCDFWKEGELGGFRELEVWFDSTLILRLSHVERSADELMDQPCRCRDKERDDNDGE